MNMQNKKSLTISASTLPTLLGPWHDSIRRAKASLPDCATLLDLSRAIYRTGLDYSRREAWADVAHELKYMAGADNLCEVFVTVNL